MSIQIQKRMLAEAVARISPTLNKSSDPTDPSQYIVLKADKKKNSLTLVVSNLEVAARLEIDNCKDMVVDEDGIFVIRGDTLSDLMQRSRAIDKITVNFHSKKDSLKAEDPTQKPIALVGMLDFVYPRGEKYSIPVIDTNSIDVPLNPTIDKGTDTFTANAGEIAKFIAQVEVCVGEDKADPRYCNVQVKASKDRYEVLTSNGKKLAWAKAQHKSCSGSFQTVLSHRQAALLAKVLDSEADVDVISCKGAPGTFVFKQGFSFGGTPVGEIRARGTCSLEDFPKFEKVIAALDLRASCKVNKQQLLEVCATLGIAKPPQTVAAFDAKREHILFSKKEDGKIIAKDVIVPISDAKGELEDMIVNSEFMLKAASHAELDQIEWSFSGKKTLMKMSLSGTLDVYFAPFNSVD